jgi:hypothetical protein
MDLWNKRAAQQQRALDASPLARLKKFVGLGSRQ